MVDTPATKLCRFITMEKLSSNPYQSCCLSFDLITFLFFNGFIRWVSSAQVFFLRFCCFLKFSNRKIEEEKDKDELCRDDVETIMKSLGLFCDPETDQKLLETRFGSDGFSRLFEEKEPSLEEVKEAFDVFDENKDGFIDASELQRVLCVLGLKEGSNLESCKKMIQSFDENKDGRIDLREFVKFMEKIFC